MLRASAQHVIVTPLSGSNTASLATDPETPLATLIEVDGLTVLVDCGASHDFDDRVIKTVEPYASKIDVVLLTSPELRSCGSLPFLLKLTRPEVVVIGTIAMAKLGLMSTVAHFLDRFSTGDLTVRPPLQVADIHSSFKRIREVQYEQSVRVTSIDDGREGLVGNSATGGAMVKALPSGRVVGGAVFCIAQTMDSICIALNATPSSVAQASVRGFDAPRGSTIVIADAGLISRVENTQEAKYSDDALFKVLRDTSRRGGSVLIPVDTFGRGAELVVSLSRLFAEQGLTFPIVFACPRAAPFADRLRTMSEFLIDGLFTEDQAEAFPGVRMAPTVDAVESIPGQKCIIAHSGDHGRGGIASALLPSILEDPLSCVVLPNGSSAPPTSNIGSLVAIATKRRDKAERIVLSKWVSRRVRPLEGPELASFLEEVTQRGSTQAADGDQGHDKVMLAADGAPVWSDDDDEDDDKPAAAAAKLQQPVRAAAAASVPAGPTRLFLSDRYPAFTSHYVMMPPVALPGPPSALAFSAQSDAGATVRAIYGEALPDDVLHEFRIQLMEHQYKETELNGAVIARSALQEDTIPCIVEETTRSNIIVQAAVHLVDWRGLPTAQEYRALFSSTGGYLSGARKLVLLHGTPEETAQARQWCVENAVVKADAPQNIAAPGLGVPVDVASAVYTFEARIDPAFLARRFSTIPSSTGDWSLGWIAGSIAVDLQALKQSDALPEPAGKRHRAEAQLDAAGDVDYDEQQRIHHRAVLPSFVLPHRDAVSRLRHDVGSVFVGDVDLQTLNRDLGSSLNLHGEAVDSVLVVADGVAVRRRGSDGQVACEAAACPEVFSIRSQLYKQFGCVL